MKRNRRRIITRAIVFLLLGAIANVAVAWCCTYGSMSWFDIVERSPLRTLGFRQSASHSMTYPKWVDDQIAHLEGPSLHAASLPVQGNQLPSLVAIPSGREAVVQEAGWPAYSLCSLKYMGLHRFHVPLSLGFDNRKFVLADCLELPLHGDFRDELIGPIRLPLSPLWPGFAINTMFYAGILWMLFAFPFVVRRRRRIKRGLCPACAYPVGTSPVCTECGNQLVSRNVRSS